MALISNSDRQLLAEMLIHHVQEQEIPILYVTATPTMGTVDFYRSLGFRPTDQPLPELLELEPDDIHMRMEFPPAQRRPTSS